jgi:hypothetical protein
MKEIVAELTQDGPREEEVERARAYAAGRRVLAFENTNAVARHGAAKSIVFGESIDPDDAIAALDAVTFEDVAEVARGIDPTTLAVACVGRTRPPSSRSSAPGGPWRAEPRTGTIRCRGRHRTAGAALPRARALRAPRVGPLAAGARAARRGAAWTDLQARCPSASGARVDRRPGLRALRRSPLARARHVCARCGTPRRLALPRRRALLHPVEFARKRRRCPSIARVDAAGIELAVEG